MMKALISIAISAVVAVLLYASLLVPIIADSTNGDTDLQVLIVAGQSNAAYRNYNVDVVNDDVALPDTEVFYYGNSTGPIYYGPINAPTYDDTFESYGIHSMVENGAWKIGGYEPVLSRAISDKTNCDVLIINVGISSASTDFLFPDNVGGEYVSNVISDALSKVDPKYSIIKIGYTWMQGESNAGSTINGYIQSFDVIHDWYVAEGFKTCYLVQTRPANGGNASIAQLQICESEDDVILASTAPATFTVENGLMESDNLHYTQKGRDIIGEDIADKMTLQYHIRASSLSSLLSVVLVLVPIGILLGLVGAVVGRRMEIV